MYSQQNGSTGYLWEDVTEKSRLALEFAERCHEGELTRLRPVLCPGHPDTCELEVLERTAEIARERNWPVPVHSGLPREDDVPNWWPGGRSVEEIVIRAYPMG